MDISRKALRRDRAKRHKRAQSSLKEKALQTIEGMILSVESEDRMLGACYRFAHAALGHCGNSHNNWLTELNETYEKLRENGIM